MTASKISNRIKWSDSDMDALETKKIYTKKMDTVSLKKVMKNTDLLLLYFSSGWCEKCDVFTPKLQKLYAEAKIKKWGLEVLHIPMDEKSDDMIEHFQTHGDWYMIGQESATSWELVYTYNVTYIPAVIVLTNKGKIITRKGMQEIEKLGVNVLVTWNVPLDVKDVKK